MIGILCGMESEAKLARQPGTCVAIGAGRTAIALQELDGLLRAGVSGLVSFGVAGALAKGLSPGTLILGTEVIGSEDEHWVATPGFLRILSGRLPDARRGPVIGRDQPILQASAKAAANALTGALAVDMESQLVARRATDLGLPFAVLRAIVDDSQTDVPEILAEALDVRGRVKTWLIARATLTGKAKIGDLLLLRRNFDLASRALLGCGAALASLGD